MPQVSKRPARPRPLPLRPLPLLLVFLGGAAGVAAREALSLWLAPGGDFPTIVFAINLTGAFMLGLLLESLARRGEDRGWRRTLRLLLGTGFMGGFTTYSTLATDTALLLGHGLPWVALLYALGTVLLGAMATWAGIASGAAGHRRASGRPAA